MEPLIDPRLRSSRDEVHVWSFPLRQDPIGIDAARALLSPAEIERAGRFKFDLHRNRFISGRAQLRRLLARYLDAAPGALEFDYSREGKPSLAKGGQQPALHFNLSHSEDQALVAVTQLGPVGVDLERIRELRDMDDLVARFFSVEEVARFKTLNRSDKPVSFFNLWTRKEAILKATGAGIAGGLNRVVVAFLPGEGAKLLSLAGDTASAAGWTLTELPVEEGFAGAVAIQAANVTVRFGRWTA